MLSCLLGRWAESPYTHGASFCIDWEAFGENNRLSKPFVVSWRGVARETVIERERQQHTKPLSQSEFSGNWDNHQCGRALGHTSLSAIMITMATGQRKFEREGERQKDEAREGELFEFSQQLYCCYSGYPVWSSLEAGNGP